MKKTDMRVYKERLLSVRARLRGDVSAMTEHTLRDKKGEQSSMPLHMADIGSENFEQEFTLSLLQSEGDTLSMIESALERIEAATYGACEECHNPIPKTRLNAIPHTPFCVKCAEKLQS
ncbi:TraR/DksA family transcriptional regulator [Planctomycetota bacterium]